MSPLFKNKYRRASSRLQDWDYSREGYYFVTICTKDRACVFGDIQDDRMVLSNIGKIVKEEWERTEKIREHVALDAWVIMPNHVHGIIVIKNNYPLCSNALQCVATTKYKNTFGPQISNLASIIRGIKSICKKRIYPLNKEFSWQPRFYDHIIRSEEDLNRIREYIQSNPLRWSLDEENPKHILRLKVQQKLKKLSETDKKKQSEKITRQLQQLPLFQKAKNILLYVSTIHEVHTHTLIRECLKTKNVFLPSIKKTANNSSLLRIYQLEKWEDLVQGPYDILEPPSKIQGDVKNMDIIIVPGVAFTKGGKRLGHGKGYYDRLLQHAKVPTIGLALREQVVTEIPTEKHDMQLNKILY